MARQKQEFFESEKCIKCENSKTCDKKVVLNSLFKESHKLNDVECRKFKRKN